MSVTKSLPMQFQRKKYKKNYCCSHNFPKVIYNCDMAPNTPNQYASVIDPFGSIDVHSLTSAPLTKQEALVFGDIAALSPSVLSANSDNKVFVSKLIKKKLIKIILVGLKLLMRI